MEKLLRYILEGICDDPSEITIEKNEEAELVQFVVKVSTDDVGKVIGKAGRNIKAIQSLLSIPARRENKKVAIKIDAPELTD